MEISFIFIRQIGGDINQGDIDIKFHYGYVTAISDSKTPRIIRYFRAGSKPHQYRFCGICHPGAIVLTQMAKVHFKRFGHIKWFHVNMSRASSPHRIYACLTHLPPDKMVDILSDDIFKGIFLNKNARILIQNSLKFVPKSPIDNRPALVQVMAWRRRGDKPLPEPMLTQFTDAYMQH